MNERDWLARDTVVHSRNGEHQGKIVGNARTCRLDGCGGVRVPVRWDDRRLTWPCSKALIANDDGSLRVG